MVNPFRVLTLKDAGEWQRLLGQVNSFDIQFEPGYYQVFSKEGKARLFVLELANGPVIYPFILRKVETSGVPGDYHDITSPYGYGGPLYPPGTSDKGIAEFFYCFERYCMENKIIAEFVRFHPLIRNHEPTAGHVEMVRNSTVVYVDLRKSMEEIWSEYDYSNRKNVNKALREGISVLIESSPRHFQDFLDIYRHTMERNRADPFYYFSPALFERIHRCLDGKYLYAHAFKDGRVVSTELLIYGKDYIHSFLGGTISEYFPYRPNNLLKHEVVLWAKNHGIKYFLLGGGRSDEDGIFRYKKTFAPHSLTDFYIGKKVHDKKAVARLTAGLSNTSKNAGFFPPYRR